MNRLKLGLLGIALVFGAGELLAQKANPYEIICKSKSSYDDDACYEAGNVYLEKGNKKKAIELFKFGCEEQEEADSCQMYLALNKGKKSKKNTDDDVNVRDTIKTTKSGIREAKDTAQDVKDTVNEAKSFMSVFR